ncbi:MAG TPA: galactokinase [Candidatus Sulfotelmatobacter sp.]|jgi:galactokinase|nr:galactokinase [Candidatus Sulfotelmatobacter sp.]
MNLQELSSHVAAEFQKHYGRAPRWIVAAPGRVNVIGEHTDYNDGFVLPMAIERYAVMAADLPPSQFASAQTQITIFDIHFDEKATIDLIAPITKGLPKWSNYIRGVLAGFQNRGQTIPALDIAFMSTVPLGGGLSSSAALEVCTATLVEAATGKTIDPVEKALLAQKAEHDFAGVPCGIMDQFISALGREGNLLLLDCRTRKTELVPMSDPSVALLVINTNVKHELSGGEYAERRAQCEEAAKNLGVKSLRDCTPEKLEQGRGKLSEVVFRRARHVIGEIERTVHAAEGIRESNWPSVGQLMYASHASLRDDYEVSCAELDAVVEIAEDIGYQGGVYGCRMTGGGFGGCCVALVKASDVDAITQQIAAEYKAKTGIDATIFSSRPAAGATIVKG